MRNALEHFLPRICLDISDMRDDLSSIVYSLKRIEERLCGPHPQGTLSEEELLNTPIDQLISGDGES